MTIDENTATIQDFWEVLFDSLQAKAHGQPIDEEECAFAADTLVAVQLANSGLGYETIEKMLDRDHEVHMKYDGAEFVLELEFLDAPEDGIHLDFGEQTL